MAEIKVTSFTLAVWALLTLSSCEPKRVGEMPRTCSPVEVLGRVGEAIETGDSQIVESVAITVEDLVWLMEGKEPDETTTPEEEEAVLAGLRRMVQNWHDHLPSSVLSGHRVGVHRKGVSLEGISPNVEVIEGSELRFELPSARRTVHVRVNRLVRVRSCWKVAEISYPPLNESGQAALDPLGSDPHFELTY
jgi:hypothetical protein